VSQSNSCHPAADLLSISTSFIDIDIAPITSHQSPLIATINSYYPSVCTFRIDATAQATVSPYKSH